jgi:hypothetical protein
MATSIHAALQHLNSINFALEHNDPAQDVSNALQVVNQAVQQGLAIHADPGHAIRVYELPVAYMSAQARSRAFELYLTRNPEIHQRFTPEEWQDEMRAFGIASDAVHQLNQARSFIYVMTFSNHVFSHSFTLKWQGDDSSEARRRHYVRDNAWHEFVILLDQRKVSNPFSFLPSLPSLPLPSLSSLAFPPFPLFSCLSSFLLFSFSLSLVSDSSSKMGKRLME